MWTARVVLPDVVQAERQATAGDAVATRVAQAACYRLQRDVARFQQWLATVRTFVAARELQAWPAAAADVVSGLAQCDGRCHVLAAQRTCQHLQHTLVCRRWLSSRGGLLLHGLGTRAGNKA